MDKPATPLDFIVVIPCFNDKPGLISALKSIDYRVNRYKVLIVDDGSDEPVKAADLAGALPTTSSFEIIRLNRNSGITRALNAGLSWISQRNGIEFECRYVARMDCGDLCSAERFYRQVQFLDKHEEIDLLGTWCVFEDFETGDKFVYRTPTADRHIRRAMYFRNIFIHPTVMWRTAIMKKNANYPEDFPHAEDYGLFYKWIDSNVRTAVLPETLVTCRINKLGLSLANRNGQLQSRLKVVRTFGRNRLLKTLGVLKLWVLMAVPYSMVFRMKKLLAGVR
jgi:glycosyltransferase involved in cell wall biosynthesis